MRLQNLQQGHLVQSPHGSNNGFPQLSRKFVARRISEGETGRLKEELKCQACGKGYKHVSSLAKHLWEHTPEWNVTSKLLISKHQQVQLLEAASILVSMNEEDDEDAVNGESAVDADNDTPTPNTTPGPKTPSVTESSRESSTEPFSTGTISTESSFNSNPEHENIKQEGSLLEQLTPAREIPNLSGKPIHKTPSKNSYHRRMSNAQSNAGSLHALGSSLERYGDSMLRGASPLPESLLANDSSHNPPTSHRRRTTSAFKAPSINASTLASMRSSRAARDSAIDEDDDGLQDPHDDSHSSPIDESNTKSRKDTQGDVFGDLEV